MVRNPAPQGYALFLVLVMLTLLFLLVTAFSAQVSAGSKMALLELAEARAETAADSGLQYGLEAMRQGIPLSGSFAAAPWILLETQNGVGTCFKVYGAGLPDPEHASLQAWGELVRGACGEYPGEPDRILAVRRLQGTIDLASFTFSSWREGP